MANHRRRSLAVSLLVLSGLTAALRRYGGHIRRHARRNRAATTVCSETHWPVSVQGEPHDPQGGRAGRRLYLAQLERVAPARDPSRDGEGHVHRSHRLEHGDDRSRRYA